MYRLFATVLIFHLASGHFWGQGGPDWGHGGPDWGHGGPDWGHGGPGPGHGGPHWGHGGPDWGNGGPDPGHGGPHWGHGGHGCDHGPGGPHDHPGNGQQPDQQKLSEFDRLAESVISADKQVQSVCQQSPVNRTSLLQAQDFYTMKYSLPEYSEQDITVKYKHRVLYVTAGPPNAETFKDLRIIPDFVKLADASWNFDNGVATVLIPYKNFLYTEVALTCGEVNESVVVVPKSVPEDELRSLGSV